MRRRRGGSRLARRRSPSRSSSPAPPLRAPSEASSRMAPLSISVRVKQRQRNRDREKLCETGRASEETERAAGECRVCRSGALRGLCFWERGRGRGSQLCAASLRWGASARSTLLGRLCMARCAHGIVRGNRVGGRALWQQSALCRQLASCQKLQPRSQTCPNRRDLPVCGLPPSLSCLRNPLSLCPEPTALSHCSVPLL